jgi:hypothetical protein
MQRMTVYFMPYYKKANNTKIGRSFLSALTLLGMLFFASFSAFSAPANSVQISAIHIKNAELVAIEENYALNADIDLSFAPAIEEALNKGVPLTFLVEFQLSTPKKYWFDDEIVTQNQRVTISYHALSRQYLVNRGSHQQSFATLPQAREELVKIKDWVVVDKRLLKKGEAYQAAIRMRLDQSRLPKPLQVEAAGSEDWAIVSERFRWTPIFAL